MSLPKPQVEMRRAHTALVITDLQNEFMTPEGAGWQFIAESFEKSNAAENIEALLRAAKEYDFATFVSPHYYYPTDEQWTRPRGVIEEVMHQGRFFARKGPLTLDGFAGSGADWPERLKPYIEDGKTVIASPHKMYGTSSNDLILQLHKRRIETIILAGPAGNLCVEAHLRDFLEHGFEIIAVRDAIGGVRNEEGDGYQAALINFRFLASALWTTQKTIAAMRAVHSEAPA